MSRRYEAVVMGASAGALEALSAILPQLPASFPLPIMLVVHLPPERNSILPELLAAKCALTVCEAEDKQPIAAGTVYVAPPDYHLLVEQERILSLSMDEPVLWSRPSIDVLFETAADAYRKRLIGVVLTGANEDGAAGIKAIGKAGGLALVQHPAEAYAAAMPEAALAACPKARALSLHDITAALQEAAA